MGFLQYAKLLIDMGFQLYATKNTHDALVSQGGINNCIMVYKPTVRREPNVSTMLRTGKLDLVINVPDSMDSLALTDGFEVRRMAVDSGIPLLVELKTAIMTVTSLHRKWSREAAGREFWSIKSRKEYVEPTVK